jgi:hypothetical protein
MNWSKVSGPGVVTFSSVTAQSTNASFSVAGTYVLRLTATDTALFASADVTIVVNPANQAPVVTAGSNQTITLPASTSLSGTATDDGWPAGSALTSTWSKVSGPGVVTFGNINALTTSASFSVAGTYLVQLVASDGALSTTATVTITVIAANQPPTVSAGSDQTITLPAAATLNGSTTDDGLPAGSTLSRTWSKLTGPGTVTFGNVNAQSTTASFSVAGTYVLQLVASDGALASSAVITIVVNPANQAPTVSAGANQTIALPASATLTGTVTDDGLPAGSTLTKTWSKISGPGNVTFNNASALSTVVSFAVAGAYVLQLAASDGLLTTAATVAITVLAVNQAPLVSTGANQTITLPASASLTGTATDDGLPLGSTLITNWSTISGPGTVTFGNVNALNTTATFSVAGTYLLQFAATDGALNRAVNITIAVVETSGSGTFTYYVDSVTGSDANPGTIAQPWKTIAKVNAAKLQPGQSVGFKRGGLWRETLQPKQSGTAGNPITFGAYGTGDQPSINGSDIVSNFALVAGMTNVWAATVTTQPHAEWIDGVSLGPPVASKAALVRANQWFWASATLYIYATGNPSSGHTVEAAARNNAIFVNQVNYITLRDLEAADANDRSVFLRNSAYSELQSLKVHDSVNQGVMIGIGGGSHTITDCDIYHTGLNGLFGTGSGLHIQNTTAPSIIQNSYIHAVGPFAGDHAVYDESGGNTYRYNRFSTPLGMGLKIDADNTTIAYNIFDTIPSGGLNTNLHSGIKIYNNIFYQCGTLSPYAAIWFNGDGSQSGVDVKNNIIFNTLGYSIGLDV